MDKKDKSQNKINTNENEKDLWAFATRDVIPLKQNKKAEAVNTHTVPAKPHNTKPTHKTRDTRTKKHSQKRGTIKIDATLDLHGLSKSLAYATLKSFIIDAKKRGHRHLLVITGKGSQYNHKNYDTINKEPPGILKRSAPQWLLEKDIQQYVSKFVTAKPQHGGEGALYVTLKKN